MHSKNVIHWVVLISLMLGACAKPTALPLPVTTHTEVPVPTPLFSTPPSAQTFPATWEVSYAGAASWLNELPIEDRQDQIRDWAVQGLIALLNLDIRTIIEIGYDQTPVRDGLFWSLANSPVGPGRGFYDGRETLHVLVPIEDPYIDRTIALVMDDYRKNSGSDPNQVVIHHYRIDESLQKAVIESETAQPAASVRGSHGYIEMPVNTLEDLEMFLGSTDHLSQVRVVNNQIWVAGWKWSNVPVGQISVRDVSALADGYTNALASSYTSLDQAALLSFYDSQVASGLLDRQSASQLFEIEDRNRNAAASEPGFSLDPGVVLLPKDALVLLAASGKYPVLASELDNLQRAFHSWESANSFETHQQAVLDLLDWYLFLEDREKQSADLVWWLFDGRAILEITIAVYPSIEPYASDLRSKFEILNDPLQSPDVQTQAADVIMQLTSMIEAFEPGAASLIWEGLGQRSRPVYQVARYDGGLQGTEAGMTYFYTDLVAKAWSFNLGEGVPYQVVDGFLPNPLAKTPWGFCPAKESRGRLWFGLRNEGLNILPSEINFGGLVTRVFTLAESESGGEEVEPEYSLGRIIWWWDRHYNAMADYEPQYSRLDQLNRWGAVLAWLKGNPQLPQLPTLEASQVIRDRQFDRWLNDHAGELRWRYDIPFVHPPGESTEALLTLYSELFEECGSTWQFSGGVSAPGVDDILTLAKERPSLPSGVARADLTNVGTLYDANTGTGKIRRVLTRSATGEPESVIDWNLKAISKTTGIINVETDGSKVWRLGSAKTWLKDTVKRNLSLSVQKQRNGFTQGLTAQDIPVGELSVRVTGRTAIVAWNPGPLSKIRRSLARLEEQLKGQSLSDAVGQLDSVDYAYPATDTTTYLKFDEQWVKISPLPSDASPDESFALRFGHPGVGDAPPAFYELRLSAAPDLGSDWFSVGTDRLLKASQAPPGEAQQLTFRRATDNSMGTIYTFGDEVITQRSDPLFGPDSAIQMFEPEVAARILSVQREAQMAQETLARGVLSSEDTFVLVEPGQLTLVDSSYPRFAELRTAFTTTPEEQLRFQVGQDFIAWIADLDGPSVYHAPQPVTLNEFLTTNNVDLTQYPARAPPIGLEPSLLEETGLIPSAIGLETRVQIIQIPLSPEVQTIIQNGADTVHWNGVNWRVISHGYGTGGPAGGPGPGTSPTPQSPELSRITLICPETVCPAWAEDSTPVP